MRFRYRRKALMWCLAMVLVTATPGASLAGDKDTDLDETEVGEPETTVPEHEITEVLSSLPVLGTGLSVTITTRGEDGEISAVALDPADGSTIIKENDHKVVFLLSDGNTEIVVKSRGDKIKTTVKADATADITGPGSWSADIFGNGLVTIPYTVSFDGNAPIITVGEVVVPDGVVAEVGEPKARVSDDDDKSSYKVKVRLTSGEEKAKVTLVAKTYVDDDDGEVKVRLSVTVSDRDRHKHWDDDDDHRDKWDRDDDDDRDGDKSSDRDHDDDDRKDGGDDDGGDGEGGDGEG
ncbi:MAG: hypothetical protein ACRDWS_10900 [Acidimicrobiia bacterium]